MQIPPSYFISSSSYYPPSLPCLGLLVYRKACTCMTSTSPQNLSLTYMALTARAVDWAGAGDEVSGIVRITFGIAGLSS